MTKILQNVKPLLLIEIHGQAPGDAVWKQLSTYEYSLWNVEHDEPVTKSNDIVGGHVIALSGSISDG